ncbi:MAG: hypothetical protein WC552_05345 [Candidatus Omnitrophota bacterium]
MKKIIGSVLVVCVCAIIFIVVARNIIVKTAVTKGIKSLAGVKVEVQKIDIGLLSPTVEVVSLKVYNPDGFADRLMADIPLVYVDYDLKGFFKNRVHLKKIRIEIKELTVVLNDQGKLNFNSLAMLIPKSGGAKSPEVSIDELYLKVGKVGYKSYLSSVGAKQMEFDPNIEETFKDVTNPAQVAADILKKILLRVGISEFAKFDISGQVTQMKQSVNEALSTNVEAVKSLKINEPSAQEAIEKTKEGLKKIFSQ